MATEIKTNPNYKHIVRIAQVDLPGNKPIKIALNKIKGIGFNLASAACNIVGIDKTKKTGDLTEEEIKRLNELISSKLKEKLPSWMLNNRKDYETGEDNHVLTGDLDFIKDNSIKHLRKIKCYRGVRHSLGQPVRGQRTRSNFRKAKGKVIGVAKTKAAPAPAKKEGATDTKKK